jgi:hypothetical protein
MGGRACGQAALLVSASDATASSPTARVLFEFLIAATFAGFIMGFSVSERIDR